MDTDEEPILASGQGHWVVRSRALAVRVEAFSESVFICVCGCAFGTLAGLAGCSNVVSASLCFRADFIQGHRDEDHHAFDHLLPERRNLQQHETVVQDADDETADHSADD